MTQSATQPATGRALGPPTVPEASPTRPSLSTLLRTHALFVALLALGAALRVVAIVAYRPAMIFPDSFIYLNRARDGLLTPERPVGYSWFLRPFVGAEGADLLPRLTAVQVTQHVLGLLLAVACYIFLRRRGLPGWGAALAVAPVLLDPLQLVLEHYILSDVLFEVLLVAACLCLGWRPRPGFAAAVTTGLLVAGCCLVRGVGIALLVTFLVALLCLRVSWPKVVAFLVAALLPLGLYAIRFHEQYGQYALASAGPRFLYARLAPIVDCHDPQLQLPAYEVPLCPTQPVGQRPDTNWYMWGKGKGPAYTTHVPRGMTRNQMLKDFDQRVVRSQPIMYTKAVLKDVARGFAPTRTYQVPGYPAEYWLFADHYWSWDWFREKQGLNTPPLVARASYDPGAAGFLAMYRKWVYLPGPLAGLMLLVAAAAAFGIGRARRSGDRVLIGLLAGTSTVLNVTGAALSGFSWRYQLPQLTLLPMAAALAVAALVRGRAAGRPEPAPPLRALDRAADALSRLPLPAAWRSGLARATEAGRTQRYVATGAGLVVAALAAGGAVGSGWFRPMPAALVGLGLGVVTAVMLLVSRHRALDGPPSTERIISSS